ncbi:MAG: GNAT family N-acetyltransferase [Gemmatimonadaceae bacterium]|nr:GNAT family N-acetyltransferase [Gloeobacterales cyanobacterium ES-bin-141]
MSPVLRIEELSSRHLRNDFTCGAEELDQYLRAQASQDVRRRVSRVFVAVGNAAEEVVGFYTLSAGSVERENLPEAQAKRLPHYPVPVALLGRLAVGVAYQGQGVGGLLIADAVRRVLKAGREIAVYALVVDARDEKAASFYAHFGFLPLTGHRLFLSLKST